RKRARNSRAAFERQREAVELDQSLMGLEQDVDRTPEERLVGCAYLRGARSRWHGVPQLAQAVEPMVVDDLGDEEPCPDVVLPIVERALEDLVQRQAVGPANHVVDTSRIEQD